MKIAKGQEGNLRSHHPGSAMEVSAAPAAALTGPRHLLPAVSLRPLLLRTDPAAFALR